MIRFGANSQCSFGLGYFVREFHVRPDDLLEKRWLEEGFRPTCDVEFSNFAQTTFRHY